MEDKIFDLLEKVYIELQDTKKELTDTKKELKADIAGIDTRLSRLEIKIEHDVHNKIGSLYEAQMITNRRLDSIEGMLETISEKVEKHDIKIKVIEGGKKKKSL